MANFTKWLTACVLDASGGHFYRAFAVTPSISKSASSSHHQQTGYFRLFRLFQVQHACTGCFKATSRLSGKTTLGTLRLRLGYFGWNSILCHFQTYFDETWWQSVCFIVQEFFFQKFMQKICRHISTQVTGITFLYSPCICLFVRMRQHINIRKW